MWDRALTVDSQRILPSDERKYALHLPLLAIRIEAAGNVAGCVLTNHLAVQRELHGPRLGGGIAQLELIGAGHGNRDVPLRHIGRTLVQDDPDSLAVSR